MSMDEIKPGTKATSTLVNRIIRQANRADEVRAPGMLRSVGPGGSILSPTPAGAVFREPALTCVVTNRDPDQRAIPAFGVAAILTDSEDHAAATGTGDAWLNSMVFNVEHGAETTGTELVIAAERIAYGSTGIAYCHGVCHALVDDDTRAALVAAGSPVILWEETDEDGEPITGLQHKAIVRFGGGSQSLREITVKSTEFNTEISTGVYGCKWTASEITGLSVAYDPADPVAIADDGICYAVDDAGEDCLLVTAGGQPGGDLYNGNAVACLKQIAVPVSGGGNVQAWKCYWL